MTHSIAQAQGSRLINRILVSTDAEAYAAMAQECGAEAPFLRPPEIADDHSTDLEVFTHALNWLAQQENYEPDLCVHLRPTYPNRTSAEIDEAITLLQEHPEWDAVRSVTRAPETPFKMWFINDAHELYPVVTQHDIAEAHSQPRQSLPAAFLQNACIDVIRSRTILEKKSMIGHRVGAYVMEHFHDIDDQVQWSEAEKAFPAPLLSGTPKTFIVDIDGVIALITPQNNYNLAQPLQDNIDRVNQLYAAGHKIVLCTARGSQTGLDWKALTASQLKEWGLHYHELHFGKPAGDYYIDDKAMTLGTFAELFK